MNTRMAKSVSNRLMASMPDAQLHSNCHTKLWINLLLKYTNRMIQRWS